MKFQHPESISYVDISFENFIDTRFFCFGEAPHT